MAKKMDGPTTFKTFLNYFVCLVVTVIALLPEVIAPPVISSELQAVTYLQKYGYMDEDDGDTSLISMTSAREAILEFQRFVGLNETGKLDDKTLAMMNKPRCGFMDKVGNPDPVRRKRYVTEGSKWVSDRLTYGITKYPKRIRDRRSVDREIAKAFKVWRHETPLRFYRSDTGPYNIEIRFEEGYHGDRKSFDGPGNTLAHASAPSRNGYVHFDDDEEWTIDQYNGTNLFQVATHEIGHSLGLLHSSVKNSLMFPFYNDEGPAFTLDEDDLNGINYLYGGFPMPKLCELFLLSLSIDAATRTEDGRAYIFLGKYYWEIIKRGPMADTADGYPRTISEDWGGLPASLDAALTWSNGQTFFFKRDKYWSFRNKKMDPGYPKLISEGFKGIPMNIDAAFMWHDKTFFFKGNEFWEYDRQAKISAGYPQPISNLPEVPDNIDSALQWNDHTYLFKGLMYYRVNNGTFSVNPIRPGVSPHANSMIVWWFNCLNRNDK